MNTDSITAELFALQDLKYRDFQSKLIPSVDPGRIIGVRTPALRSYAGDLCAAAKKDPEEMLRLDEFLSDLPHKYFDEDQLHAFIISLTKDFDVCVAQTEAFLPFIDNWATCDQLSPKVFAKHKEELLVHIKKWIGSPGSDGLIDAAKEDTYRVRFGIGMLMQHYLDDAFDPEYPAMVASVRSGEYYVNMMRAWYFATALAKRWDETVPYIEERRLDTWTYSKTIQKAVESYRISGEKKDYLRQLKSASSGVKNG